MALILITNNFNSFVNLFQVQVPHVLRVPPAAASALWRKPQSLPQRVLHGLPEGISGRPAAAVRDQKSQGQSRKGWGRFV